MLAAALLAGSCIGAPAERRDVVLGLVGEPSSLYADHPSAHLLLDAVTEQLVRRDPRHELVARLAEEVPTFENGGLRVVADDSAPTGRLVATLRIRADARWHDGRPVTAGDVVFGHDEDRSAPAGTPGRSFADRVERVEAVAERVVRVMGRPGERWDDLPLAARALPRHVLAGATPDARAAYARAPLHAGPFRATSWEAGVGLTLEAFAGYVGGRPGLARIAVRFFSDRGALLDALRRGDVDIAPAPALEADLARSLDRIADGTDRTRLQTYYTQAEALDVLRFGARFADRDVRRAFELAIDRHALVEGLFAGRARVPRTYLVPPGWAAADLGAAPARDRTTARALLAAAGYRSGNFGILERPGDRLVITIAVAPGSAARADAARLVAGDLAAVGIAADVREVADLPALVASGAFDLAIVAEDASDPLVASERYLGRVGPWFDVLARAASQQSERSERRALYAEMQRSWLEATAGVPLYQHLDVDVAPRDLRGVQPAPHGASLAWNVAEWRFTGP